MQELLGGYRILETRAAAATGSKTPFYLAERDELAPGMPAGMRFLLKVLPREVFLEIPPAAVARESHAGMSIESSIAEFVRWARCYATLSHAALVRLFEVFEYEERIVLVLDPLETPPLATWLQRLSARTQVLDDGSIAWIGTRLFGALSAAHVVRDPVTGQPTPIAHGSISPQCVLVSTKGDVRLSGYPWVATPTVLPPSRFHRSPEQARSGVTTARSDIYSACLLLWELYARKGAVPRTLAPAEIDARLSEPNLPPLEVLRPDLPPRLIDGLRRGLVPDERLRGATAGELLGLFQELSRGGEARLATTLRALDDVPPSRAPSSRYPGARVTDELVSDAATVVGSHDAKTVAGDAAAYGAIPSPAAPLQAATAAPRPAPRPSETGMKAASPTPPRATPGVPRVRPSQPGMQAQPRAELAPKAAVPARTNLGKATLLGISAAGSEPPAPLPPPATPPARPMAAVAPAGAFERLSAADLLAEAGMPVGDSEPPGKLPFGTKGPEPRTQRMAPQRPQPPAGRASPSEAAAGFQSSVKKAEEELAALGASKPLFVEDPSETEATTQLPALDENGAPSRKGADFLPGSSRDVALPVAPREPSAPWAVEPPVRPQAPSAEIWAPAPSDPPEGPLAAGDPFAAPLPPPGQPPVAQPFAPFAPSDVAPPKADDISAPMPPPVLAAPPSASKAPLFMGLFAAVLLIGGAGAAGLVLRARPATGPKAPSTTATASAQVTATEAPNLSATATATPTPSATASATPAPSTTASATPAPSATATATAEPTTAPQAGAQEGILDTGTAASGRRVFVDGKVVGQTPLKQAIRCGPHRVKVGSSGTEKPVQIPCGGSVTVN